MSNRVNEIRNFSEEVLRSIAPTVSACKQYLGITTFGYRRFLSDGKSFGFSDHSCWNQVFLQHFTGTHIPEYEKDFQKFIVLGENYIVRKGVPPKGNRFFEALYEINIWNTLVVYIRNPDNLSVEAFFFGATRDAIHMAEIYAEKYDLIQHLIKLIQAQLTECFTREIDTYFSSTLKDLSCLKSLENFLNVEKRHKSFNNILMSLSKREREIACLLVKGYKRRDIASKLDIAPKTVDANLEHIKNKTCTVSKTQFLKFLQQPAIEEELKRHDLISF